MKTAFLLKFYIAFSSIYLILLLLNWEATAFPLKAFLMPALIAAVYFHSDFTSKKFLLGALIFSWIGDVVLMFQSMNPLFFIGGLIAFLIGHIIYMMLFIKEKRSDLPQNSSFLRIGLMAIIAYLIVMLTLLFPHLGGMSLPVTIYALTISAMLATAIRGYSGWESPANAWILRGAILFVMSDSILAFNKFYQPIWLASFFIMVTYLAAQYAIVVGVFKLPKYSRRDK